MILGLFLRIATLRRNQAECIGACLDDFEDVIFLRRKIVDGIPRASGSTFCLYGSYSLIDDHQKLARYNNDFCILLHTVRLERLEQEQKLRQSKRFVSREARQRSS